MLKNQRGPRKTQSILDLVLTHNPNAIQDVKVVKAISDFDIIIVLVDNDFKRERKRKPKPRRKVYL